MGYYRKAPDDFMWDQFDHLARRLGHSVSAALTLAANEWLDNHENDPSPDPSPVRMPPRDPFNGRP
jgi:Mn-dependent DtxR family transcriptional regulator